MHALWQSPSGTQTETQRVPSTQRPVSRRLDRGASREPDPPRERLASRGCIFCQHFRAVWHEKTSYFTSAVIRPSETHDLSLLHYSHNLS